MSQDNNKKLFIISPPDPTQNFKHFFTQIENHFDKILRLLNISTPYGKLTSIKLTLDLSKRDYAIVTRLDRDPAKYEIRISTGYSRHLWQTSRVFASDYNLLPWVEQCKVNDKKLERLSKKEILADYAYFISSYFIVLHEISHILLGHSDYLIDKMGGRKEQSSPEEIKLLKSFEAEADRQAGELLLVFFERSLERNGAGDVFSFPSKLHAYEFYVYAITATLRMLQDLTEGEDLEHPKPNERLYVLVAFALSAYFKQNLPEEHDAIYYHAIKSCLEAGKKLLVIDSYDPLTVIENAHNLDFVDDVVRETSLRHYQHTLEVVSENTSKTDKN